MKLMFTTSTLRQKGLGENRHIVSKKFAVYVVDEDFDPYNEEQVQLISLMNEKVREFKDDLKLEVLEENEVLKCHLNNIFDYGKSIEHGSLKDFVKKYIEEKTNKKVNSR